MRDHAGEERMRGVLRTRPQHEIEDAYLRRDRAGRTVLRDRGVAGQPFAVGGRKDGRIAANVRVAQVPAQRLRVAPHPESRRLREALPQRIEARVELAGEELL